MDIFDGIKSELELELKELYKKQERLVTELYEVDLQDDLNSLRIRKKLKNINRDTRTARTSLRRIEMAPGYKEDTLINYISRLIGYYYNYMEVLNIDTARFFISYQRKFLEEFANYKKWSYCSKDNLVKIYLLLDYKINPYKYRIEEIKNKEELRILEDKGLSHAVGSANYNRYDMICNLANLNNISDEEYNIMSQRIIEIYISETEDKFNKIFNVEKSIDIDKSSRIEIKKYILRHMYYDLNLTEDRFISDDEKITINLLMAIKKLVVLMENDIIYSDLSNILKMFMKYLYDKKLRNGDFNNYKYMGNIEVIYILEASGVLKEEDIPVYSFEELKKMTDDIDLIRRIDEIEKKSNIILDKRRRLILRDVDHKEISLDDETNIQLEVARLKKITRVIYSEIRGYIK